VYADASDADIAAKANASKLEERGNTTKREERVVRDKTE